MSREIIKYIEGHKLKLQINVEGTGRKPVDGDEVIVHYFGTLEDGTKFDSSFDRNEPFAFFVGKYQVIQGWEVAIKEMRVGTHATVTIPPELGYGFRHVANGAIPPNSTLIFDIELVSFGSGKMHPNIHVTSKSPSERRKLAQQEEELWSKK